ncbi:hypothetical protein PENTCL1PPCAC_11948, partial [Pristionchus entomophagus]
SLLLIFFLISSAMAGGTTKSPGEEKIDQFASLVVTPLVAIICVILNMATIVLLFKALQEARRIPDLMDKHRLSMHWLSRTAIRHAIGPNAKKILLGYVEAKWKEEKEKKEK